VAWHDAMCYRDGMAAVAFDTLKLARRLEGAGFSREQAVGTAEALADTLAGGMATKDDLTYSTTELKADIAQVRTELKADIAQVRTELKAEIAEVRAELKAAIAELRAEIAEVRAQVRAEIAELRGELKGDIAALRSDVAKWIIGAVLLNAVTVLGAIAAVWQLAHR